MTGRMIVAEGCDRLGKSTQVAMLIEHLRNKGYRVAYLKSPHDDGFTKRIIYWMLGNGLAQRFQNLFQVLHFTNRMFCQRAVLPKLLESNDFIIIDRWTASMFAYGIADGANKNLTRWMTSKSYKPDMTIILDGEPHIKSNGDAYENDTELQRRVRGLYIQWSYDDENSVMINANRPVQTVFDDVLKHLANRFSV